jgi:hypothetical protein
MNKEDDDDMQRYKEMMKKPKKDYNAKISKLDKMMKDMKEQDNDDMQRYKEMMKKPKKNYNAKISKLDKMMTDMNKEDNDDLQRYKMMMKKPKYFNNVINTNTNFDDVVETVVKAVVKEVVEVMDIIPKHVKIVNEAHRRALLADMKAKREAYERWKNRTEAEILEDKIKADKELIERLTRKPDIQYMNENMDIHGVRLPQYYGVPVPPIGYVPPIGAPVLPAPIRRREYRRRGLARGLARAAREMEEEAEPVMDDEEF